VDVYVARQPILDTTQVVFAYELLFRSGPENFFSHRDADDASRRVIDNTFHAFGLDTLAGNKRLFINCTRRVLVDGTIALLPPESTVAEVLETVDADDEVVGALRTIKQSGFTLALDDFVFRPGLEPLVQLADIIKVDFLLTKGDERAKVCERFGRQGLRFLAEKVETHAEFEEAKRLGYSLFQGYFFARPQMMEAKALAPSKLAKMRMMAELMSQQVDFDRLEQTIKGDVALSVKLLRFLNSAHFGWRSEIGSLKHALVLLGDRPFRQWATLVILTILGDGKPDELLLASLVRARFCEQLALRLGRRAHSFELFLAGLVSALDAILGRPLPELLEAMAVSKAVRGALLEGTGELADIYTAVRGYEEGRFEAPSLAALTAQSGNAVLFPETYRQSVEWAQSLAW
jgi:EAL and modified HD-GYP domain-containing signal transduction protein